MVYYNETKSILKRATWVKECDYVKSKVRRNFPPVLKIVTRTAHAT